MSRRAILSGSLVLCALTAMATAEDPRYNVGWARDPWNDAQRTRQPRPALPPGGEGRSHRDGDKTYAIPSGAGGGGRCYTGIVIVPSSNFGSLRVTFNDGHCEFPITVQGGQTFVLPFPKGWHPDCRATISADTCDGDFVAWAITDDGPVRLDVCR